MMLAGAGNALAIAGAAETIAQEIQTAIVLAKRFPRSEADAREKIIRCCQRKDFAEKARYKYSRGQGEKKTDIIGPSIVVARELARLWGNIRYGYKIISDTEEHRMIEAYAWDLETNQHEIQHDTFRKLQQRTQKDGPTIWVVPDERDLAELTRNKAGRIVRNCIIHVMPFDLVADVVEAALSTCVEQARKDPDGTLKDIIAGFSKINVPIKELENYVGHALNACSPEELEELRAVWHAIQSGEEKWRDYYNPNPTNDPVQMDPATASVFQGATGQTVPRPHQDAPKTTPQGPDDATRAYLPKELHQQPGDNRPESEHLLDVIGVGSKDAVDSVLAYLAHAKHIAASDRLALMRACTARAADFAQETTSDGPSDSSDDVPFAPTGETVQTEDDGGDADTYGDGQTVESTAETVQQPPKEEPEKIPDEVIRCFQEMRNRAHSGRMAVEFAYRVRWLNVVEKRPDLEPWTPRVLEERESIIANVGK